MINISRRQCVWPRRSHYDLLSLAAMDGDVLAVQVELKIGPAIGLPGKTGA
jgi:hypothetical protein